MTKSVLQSVLRAKKGHKHFIITPEHIKLAKMWLKGEVTLTQLNTGLKIPSSSTYTTIARALKQSYEKGEITLKN